MRKNVIHALILMGMPTGFLLADNSLNTEILWEFERPGSQPISTLTKHSNGNFYGTTTTGGTFDLGCVYRLTTSGEISIVHSFSGVDGASPATGLVEGSDGDLYGTTAQGGTLGFGTLYKVTPAGEMTILVEFTGLSGSAPGSVPGELLLHSDGNFYGITEAGGALGLGTVFRLNPNGSFATVLEFSGNDGPTPGSQPLGPLATQGASLYGTTRFGGANGLGVLFEVSTEGNYQLLGSFTGISGVQAGANPATGLIRHSDGNLYGATGFGGADDFGVLFKITTNGSGYSILHTFTDSTGSKPAGRLAEDLSGNLWGVTATGGTLGLGTIYRISTAGLYANQVNFSGETGDALGANPVGGLFLSNDGKLYGTTSAGGPGQRGAVFAFSEGGGYEPLGTFTSDPGWSPSGAVSVSPQNVMRLPLAEGGSTGNGTLAQINQDGSISPIVPIPSGMGAHPNGPLVTVGNNQVGVMTSQGQTGRGGIFELSPTGTVSLLKSFTSTTGEGFFGPLLETTAGNLFGVSQAGGLGNNGTVFKFDNAGTLSRAFSFTGTSGSRLGNTPRPPLAETPDGTIFGVTENGGSNNQGTLFSYTSDGTVTTLVNFTDSGPRRPAGGLLLGSNGRLYGTCREGGNADAGVIFEFNPGENSLQVVADFTGSNGILPGSSPAGPLTMGPDGAIYGLTSEGGSGFGTAFRFFPGDTTQCLAIFSGINGPTPGIVSRFVRTGIEIFGGISVGSDGLIYGALPAGGAKGGGVLFRITTLSPLDNWKKQFLGDAKATDLGDSDKDLLPNLLEYALDKLPHVLDHDSLLSPKVVANGNNSLFKMAFQRNTDHSDVMVFVETSVSPGGPWDIIAQSDAGQAFQGSAQITETPLSGSTYRVEILDPSPIVSGEPRFFRLRAIH